MERYGNFGDMFNLSNGIRESQEFHLNEAGSEWLKKEIQAFMNKYDVDDWDEAVSMYATHNVLPEEKVRAALGESINEQDDEEKNLDHDEEGGMKDTLSDEEGSGPEDSGLEDEEPMPEDDFMEDEADIPVPEDKEYVGKSEDTHFYMVPEKNDQGEIIDMKIVDQEENQLFSAEENGIEPTDMSLFLNTVFRDGDIGISEIDRQVVVKYIIPAAEQEMVDDMRDEEEDLMGAPADDIPDEDLDSEEEFDEEGAESPEEEEEDVDFEEEGDKKMRRPKKGKGKEELMRPMESKLTEKKIEFDGHSFEVQLVDEGTDATTISVNGREFRYSSDFASLFQDEGVLTESGVEELAKDALSNLSQKDFEELAEGSAIEDFTKDELKKNLNKRKLQGEELSAEEEEKRKELENESVNEVVSEQLHDAIEEFIRNNPGVSQKKLMKKFGSDTNEALSRLVDLGRVKGEEDSYYAVGDRLGESISRQHYMRVADLLKSMKNRDQAKELAMEMVSIFQGDKSDFDSRWFLAMANIDKEQEIKLADDNEEMEESKAKVRNRGKVVFPAGSKVVIDDKDHFPINSADQARNALARVNQYSASPKWYKGSLASLKKKVASAVKSAYPSIEVTSKAVESKGIKEGLTYMDEAEAYERYDEFLEEVYGMVELGHLRFSPVQILKKLDPTAYDTGFNDWTDSENITTDSVDDEDEGEEYEGGDEDGDEDVIDQTKRHLAGDFEDDDEEDADMKAKESKADEKYYEGEGDLKHVFLVRYFKDDGETAEMKVEALDANDAKMMIMKRKGTKEVVGVPKQIGESKVDEALSRKYYIQFADMLKGMENREEAKAMAARMAEMFKADNPRFDQGRFMTAANLAMEEAMDTKSEESDMEEEVEESGETDECSNDKEEEVDEELTDESQDAAGKRDGTGPYKKSRRAEKGMVGMRKSKGETCPNESKVVFAENDRRVRDGKVHFQITNENLATKAIKRVGCYSKAPAWFDGTVEELQGAVREAVSKEYPTMKIEEHVEEEKRASKKLDESNDSAFCLAQELLGLNESVDEMGAIEVGTEVHIMAKRGMSVIHESIKVAQVNESGVEVTGNAAEVDQEWYSFDTCHIYPV